MILLVVAGLLLMAAAAWYLARPLIRTPMKAAGEEYFQLCQVRDRLLGQLNELDSEAGDRSMDPAVVADERARLEAELAHVLLRLDAIKGDSTPAAVETSSRRAWITALAMFGLLLPLGGAGLYWLNQGTVLELLSAAGGANPNIPPEAIKMVARLERRLADSPDDPAGWARLGRAYAVMGRPEDAKAAYARSVKQAPDNLETLSEYAWLLYSENPSNTEGEVFRLYQRINQLQPENPDALWFLGLAAYQKNDPRVAVAYWERLLKSLPPGSPTAEHLRNVIVKARARKS
jgi:cytochrome c-type biogenesis protein CcmH